MKKWQPHKLQINKLGNEIVYTSNQRHFVAENEAKIRFVKNKY